MNSIPPSRSRRCLRVGACFGAFAAAAMTLPIAGIAATIVQEAHVLASNMFADDQFGYSVAVSGDTMVIGAPFENGTSTGVNGSQTNCCALDSGAVYVFVRSGANWIQQAYLKASNTGGELAQLNGDVFGGSVAIAGDTIVVGATGEDSNATGVNGNQSDNSAESAGAAYVFVRSGTTWTQSAYLKASNTGAGDGFGCSVAISGGTIIIGACQESSSATGVNGNQLDNSAPYSGAAYVFVRDGSNWSQQAYLKASNTGGALPGEFGGDLFGRSVAVSGDTVVVGADWEDSSGTGVNGERSDNNARDSGAAYVFVRNGTNWLQQAYLKASNTDGGDYFGISVAISCDTVVVGALGEDSGATGVNGDQTDNSASYAGAAYVFVRDGTNWTQQAYLKASNTSESDLFGVSVAVAGDTIVVGANQATGISGAAYVYWRNASNWIQANYLKPAGWPAGLFSPAGFGASVAASGETVVIGAPFDELCLDIRCNWSIRFGAAYVFRLCPACTPLAIASDAAGGYFIRFTGAPDVTYRLQRAADVTGPWETITTLSAPASGLIEYHDTDAPPGQAFYRSAQP